MESQIVTFPDTIKAMMNQPPQIDLERPVENVITIDQTDYIPYYLDNLNPGNKGRNSHVLKLVNAQYFEDDYPEPPDLVLKICRSPHSEFYEGWQSSIFKNEIDALLVCGKAGLPNTMDVMAHGIMRIAGTDSKYRRYRFYAMPFAEHDLTGYLVEKKPSYSERIDLCIEICDSLNQIWSKGFYHRDIKPDNILFTDQKWVISDLGLAKHRDAVESDQEKSGWIGPRGWMSPEAMNKFLAGNKPWSGLYNQRIDHQSDIFQLGKVFWYILQGNSPVGAIRRKNFKLADDTLYQIIRTMLNHEKNNRPREISEVSSELRRVGRKMLIHGEPALLY